MAQVASPPPSLGMPERPPPPPPKDQKVPTPINVRIAQGSDDDTSRRSSASIPRKPLHSPPAIPIVRTPSAHYVDAPSTPVKITTPDPLPSPMSARGSIRSQPPSQQPSAHHSRQVSLSSSSVTGPDSSLSASASRQSLDNSTSSAPPLNGSVQDNASVDWPLRRDSKPPAATQNRIPSDNALHTFDFGPELSQSVKQQPSLHYHHNSLDNIPKIEQRMSKMTLTSTSSEGSGSNSTGDQGNARLRIPNRPPVGRPSSAYTVGSELRGRTNSPLLTVDSISPAGSPLSFARNSSRTRLSPDNRPTSYIETLHSLPYSQQIAPSLGNEMLRLAVGSNANLLDTRKTLEMYRQNVKKTTDPSVQYEFAVFMVQAAAEVSGARSASPANGNGIAAAAAADPQQAETARIEMLKEARGILQRLADRAYPFAQYYLADGYASGLFNLDSKAHRNEPDPNSAFPLFVAASKHGHAEACYRAALCYEFGWGCRKDYAKAVQFYRTAASKGHPGAATRFGKACLTGDLGLGKTSKTYREGVKWLKRGAEAADAQYNSAPYELGLLHVTGYGDDIFKDETYAAQLFTQAADLGNVEANWTMGEAYEYGNLGCPRDPALSVHFYNGAATKGDPRAMMALCAWYLVGADPILPKDEGEACEWARRAAELGFPKAEYAVGYFTEMGIGCRRDPLEANVWYVRAADHGDDRAKQRLAIIRAAAAGDPGIPASTVGERDGGNKKGLFGKLRGKP